MNNPTYNFYDKCYINSLYVVIDKRYYFFGLFLGIPLKKNDAYHVPPGLQWKPWRFEYINLFIYFLSF